MTALKDILCSPDKRPQVVRDAARLVETEVDSKGGLSGIAIKAAFKTVTKLKPGLVPEVVDSLLERFVEQLEPFYKEWVDGGKKEPFDGFLNARKTRVANALLAVTDARARQVSNQTLKKSYEALRPQGEKQVEAAIPNMGKTLGRHLV